jgi:hypothetical protein
MKNQQILEAMRKFVNATVELQTVWELNEPECNEILSKEYPFNDCFRDLLTKIHNWSDNVIDEINYRNENEELDTVPRAVNYAFENTGGGCMLSTIDVVNCGNVVQFMMDEEGINAYDVKYGECDETPDPLYVFDKYSNLKDMYGELLADQVMNELKRYCHKYNVYSEIGDGKWQEEFEEMKLKKLAGNTYREKIADYVVHLREVSEHLIENLDTTGYDEKVHDMTITIDGKSLVVPLNADSYQRMRKFLLEEYEEG